MYYPQAAVSIDKETKKGKPVIDSCGFIHIVKEATARNDLKEIFLR